MVGRALAGAACAVLLVSCVTERERRQPAAAPTLTAVAPDKITAGRIFNPQSTGDAAIAVTGENLFRGTRILWNGEPLETYTDGRGRQLSAVVPPRLFERPGTFAITLDHPDGVASRALTVRVLPAAGAVPVIGHVYPESSPAGKLFSPQPGGLAAMSVTGANYLPGAVIVLGGVDLQTVFGDEDRLSAFVPPAMIARPRQCEVRVRNPDGKLSPPARMTITPAS